MADTRATPTPPPFIRGPAPGHRPSSDPSSWVERCRRELAAARERRRAEAQERSEEAAS